MCNGISPEQRADELERQVLEISEIERLIPGSTQDVAYQWLVNEDELQVCPDQLLDVRQRYVMALLYFATDGDNWISCARSSPDSVSNCPSEYAAFLSGVNVCLWLNVTCSQNEILGISIGTYDRRR